MQKFLKYFIITLFSAGLAFIATIFLPAVNYLVHGESKSSETPKVIAQVEMKNVEQQRPRESRQREVRRPTRARPTTTPMKAGPRFAMELGVAGSGGALAPLEIVNKRSGGGGLKGATDEGDVDERPTPQNPPPFRIPDAIKSSEKDALLILGFCVDTQGRPYDIQIVEEKPSGLGMAQSGREALQQTSFSPARKGGLPVAFCGLEQPFEVRFSN